MQNYNLTKNISLRELVPRDIFNVYKERAEWFLDPKIPLLAQAYRDWFEAPVIINNKYRGGSFDYRGYRPHYSTTGAKHSQHRFGRAFDCHIKGLSYKKAYMEIIDNFEYFSRLGLTTLEDIDDTKGWIHSDVRYTGSKNLLIVSG